MPDRLSINPVRQDHHENETESPAHANQNWPRHRATPNHNYPKLEEVCKRYPTITGLHEACEAVPRINSSSFDHLVEAIRKDGQLDTIKIDADGRVIDGRSRLYACYVLNLEPRLETCSGDPWVHARANYARRHLTTGQLAVLATRLLDREAPAAKKRRSAGLRRGTAAPVGQTSDRRRGRAAEIVASQVGVSRDSVYTAAKLPKQLQAKVSSGEMSLNQAAIKAKIKKARKSKPQDSVVSIHSPQLGNGIKISYESSTVVVLRHLATATEAIVYGPVEHQWRFRLVDASGPRVVKSRAAAIDAASKLLIAKLRNRRTKLALATPNQC